MSNSITKFPDENNSGNQFEQAMQLISGLMKAAALLGNGTIEFREEVNKNLNDVKDVAEQSLNESKIANAKIEKIENNVDQMAHKFKHRQPNEITLYELAENFSFYSNQDKPHNAFVNDILRQRKDIINNKDVYRICEADNGFGYVLVDKEIAFEIIKEYLLIKKIPYTKETHTIQINNRNRKVRRIKKQNW